MPQLPRNGIPALTRKREACPIREDGKLLIRNSSRDDVGAEPMAVSEILARRKWTGGLTLVLQTHTEIMGIYIN